METWSPVVTATVFWKLLGLFVKTTPNENMFWHLVGLLSGKCDKNSKSFEFIAVFGASIYVKNHLQ